jgi:predicted tellurium resistance membrane protein TerC
VISMRDSARDRARTWTAVYAMVRPVTFAVRATWLSKAWKLVIILQWLMRAERCSGKLRSNGVSHMCITEQNSTHSDQ